ncbi:hypothetical protein HPG69_004295 [Diceros bicornis minor]|uniref:Minor histocompatibility protein HA-1 n=1 Tax=Diceros bicornis minor TaxID=77932 RepID=A0A7J7F6F7_DICBM|nr:hypothetical protein HPG69_004295 [Diceros bicornis minor]
MFSRKKRELMKTPSISKKNRAGSPSPQPLGVNGPDAVSLGPSLEPLSAASNVKATGTLKRPTSLSRHASAAGFPLSGSSSWTLGRGHRSPMTAASPADVPIEGPGPDTVEDISHLLAYVARFAEGLEKLKECVLRDDLLEARRPLAHERLGEALRVIHQVVYKYPLLNTLETLTAAGTLIAKIKGFRYECNNESDKQEFEKALETIAVSFSSTVSEFLMGEVDSSTLLSLPPGDPSQSMESLYGPGSEGAPTGAEDCDEGCPPPEAVDVLLQRCEGGVDAALQYAKNMAKYMKDLIGYLEKRTTLGPGVRPRPGAGGGHAADADLLAGGLRPGDGRGRGPGSPLTARLAPAPEPAAARTREAEEGDQGVVAPRPEEAGTREGEGAQEAEYNLRKAKQGYTQRCEDHDKARFLVAKAEEEQASAGPGAGGAASKTLDKRRRLEEEAKNKAEEAMATYRTCVADAKTQKQGLEDAKVTALRQIQEVIRQSDQTIKSTAPLPVHFQMLCESSKLYDPGQQYASHVRQLQRGEEPDVHYDFEPHVPTNAWSPVMRARKGSFNVSDAAGAEAAGSPPEEAGPSDDRALAKERRDLHWRCLPLQAGADTRCTNRGPSPSPTPTAAWTPALAQVEGTARRLGAEASVGSPCGRGVESVPAEGPRGSIRWPSPSCLGVSDLPVSCLGDFKKFERTSSSGTMSSSEELADQEGSAGASAFEQADLNGMASELPPVAIPSGPFRHVGLSKAARTHRLRKLRTPAKCRECNSYVYFQGAECEECCLACHKKCLETLAIQCGHKKLQGRLQLFGQDFSQAACSTPDGVPFIVKKCVCEIERRALRTKGIYRVNGVKTRVEKLCQAFETGKELVELSQAPPHDISNVLKLYLRQLPEPLISFRFYHELVGLAKDNLKAEAEAKAASRGRPDPAESEAAAVAMAGRLRELLRDLPPENRATLQYLLRHLRRLVEVEQDNKMTPGNLGIVFGPTLLRPRPTEATVSLSSLVDYPHQARIVETLITHYGLVFEEEPEEMLESQDGPANQRAEVALQVPYLEVSEEATFPRQEEAEEGGPESRAASNDSDSELEETLDPLSLAGGGALPRLSLLESVDEGRGGRSRSGSEEQLGAEAGDEDGDRDGLWEGHGEGLAGQLSESNTNQSNNVAQARLHAMQLCGGQVSAGSGRERRPEFV